MILKKTEKLLATAVLASLLSCNGTSPESQTYSMARLGQKALIDAGTARQELIAQANDTLGRTDCSVDPKEAIAKVTSDVQKINQYRTSKNPETLFSKEMTASFLIRCGGVPMMTAQMEYFKEDQHWHLIWTSGPETIQALLSAMALDQEKTHLDPDSYLWVNIYPIGQFLGRQTSISFDLIALEDNPDWEIQAGKEWEAHELFARLQKLTENAAELIPRQPSH